ncbi:phosphotransferase family protein [Actinoplanes sp. NPDC049596]|uniref:phosphotransferase family protein n=1 Tax=unclassified Actinoplanes TaxID=2626549 RepID=UPI00342D2902
MRPDSPGNTNSWIEDIALPGRRVISTRPLTGGYSNENVLVTTDDGGRYVLRRCKRPEVEAALARRAGGVVPTAEVIAVDANVLLMAFVPGRLLGDVIDELSPLDAAALGRDVGRTLAALGSVTFDDPGFFTGGSLATGAEEPTDGLDVFVRRCLDEGNAAGYLTAEEQSELLRLAARSAAELAELRGSRQLVHSDFNPKNLLVSVETGRVTAVLDWEFAFSGPPLADVGNMLRDPRPPAFETAFLDGFREAGGALPENWRSLSQALDLFSLADFLTRPVEHRYFQKAVRRIKARVP